MSDLQVCRSTCALANALVVTLTEFDDHVERADGVLRSVPVVREPLLSCTMQLGFRHRRRSWRSAPGDSCRLTSVRPERRRPTPSPRSPTPRPPSGASSSSSTLLGLPIVDRDTDPDNGLTFEFLSSRGGR
ncbi:MAG: hypothetical protein R2697_13160 [Ilumatobacteraceae bacterium]